MYRLTAFFIVLSFSLNLALSQSNFSETFTYFPKNMHVYVPAVVCTDNDFQSNFIYKAYIGKLSIIRSYYADANMNIASRDRVTKFKHIVGAGLFNDREGDFFNKTRVVTRYAMHIPLQEGSFLSVGTALHLVNYRFGASTSGASGSAFNWAGSIGAALYTNSYQLAFSFNDFNNPRVRPINYAFSVYRYLTLYGEKTLDLNANTQLKGASRCNFVFGNSSSYWGQLGLVLSKVVGINMFYGVHKAWGFAFDVNAIKIKKSLLDFSIAYQIPQKNVYPSANQYELNLRYHFLRDQ